MPYRISLDDSRRGFLTIYSGVLTNEEFVRCMKEKFTIGEEFLSKEYIDSFNYSLSDFTDVTSLDIDLEAIKKNAALTDKVLQSSTSGVMAVIAPTDLEFGLGRLWQTYADDAADRIKLFRSRQEAEDWLSAKFGAPES